MRYRPYRDWAPSHCSPRSLKIAQHGKDITAGGARYNFSGVQGIGIANLSDSLYALKGMVFDQQRLSFDQLMAVLKANSRRRMGKRSAPG